MNKRNLPKLSVMRNSFLVAGGLAVLSACATPTRVQPHIKQGDIARMEVIEPRQSIMTLSDVLFETGKASLRPGAQSQLQELLAYLEMHPDRDIVIEGHTDNVGNAAYNLDLSQERAQAVRHYLVERGVDSGRIDTVAFGKNAPAASNSTEAGRQLNRRVEVIALDAR